MLSGCLSEDLEARVLDELAQLQKEIEEEEKAKASEALPDVPDHPIDEKQPVLPEVPTHSLEEPEKKQTDRVALNA